MLDDMEAAGEIRAAKKERCKPDFEAMIKSAKESLSKNEHLYEAIFNYVGNSRVRGKLAELVGELASGARQLKARIEQLMKEEEDYHE